MVAAGSAGRSHRRKVFGWAFVLVSLGFIMLVLNRQGGELPRLRSDLESFGWALRPGWLTAALALGTADLFLMGWVWVLLFRSLGGRVGTGEGIRVWMTTNLGRYIPGKIWQLTGLALYMRERRGAGAAALTAAGLYQALVLGTGVAVAAATLGSLFLADGALIPTIILLAVLLLVRSRVGSRARLPAGSTNPRRRGHPAAGRCGRLQRDSWLPGWLTGSGCGACGGARGGRLIPAR